MSWTARNNEMAGGSYPTQEQAAAAALLGAEVGDRVFLHQAHCQRQDDTCDCGPTVLTLTADGWCLA